MPRSSASRNETKARGGQALAPRVAARHLSDMQDVNERKVWTQMDDDDLRLEVSNGETIERAATFLCRPADEIIKRAAELGLRWHGTRH
jgi:hypothetical protein